ncbi:MAG TPA: response regulator [Lysobacter sp.]|nr:response regulator [Lysobacter sp.]
MRLPRGAGAKQPEPRTDATGAVQVPCTRLRLMVVDDNTDVADVLCLLLEALGHTASVEHDATHAIERARRESPQMLFLDIGLPDLDGYELARRLRAMPETADAVLVAVTGYGQAGDRDRAHEAGFDHHLVKPVKLVDLRRLLDKLAGAHATG